MIYKQYSELDFFYLLISVWLPMLVIAAIAVMERNAGELVEGWANYELDRTTK